MHIVILEFHAVWYKKELLPFCQSFSSEANRWSDYCLAHLFTHQPFDNNVLGLAYIAGSRSTDVGGLCSPCELNILQSSCCKCPCSSVNIVILMRSFKCTRFKNFMPCQNLQSLFRIVSKFIKNLMFTHTNVVWRLKELRKM